MTDCPYSKTELQIALLGVTTKVEKWMEAFESEAQAEEKMNEIFKDLEVLEGAALNAAAAKHHGVTVEFLLSSPNFATLRDEYVDSRARDVLERLQKTFGLDIREAWALLLRNQIVA